MTDGAEKAVAELIEATNLARPASPEGEIGAVDKRRVLNSFEVEGDVTNAPNPWASGAPAQPLNKKLGVRKISVIITNSAPYFKYIEADRAAGAKPPPVKVLYEWLQSRHGHSPGKAKYIAKQLAKKIAINGLKSREIVTSSRRSVVGVYQKVIIDALRAWRDPRNAR